MSRVLYLVVVLGLCQLLGWKASGYAQGDAPPPEMSEVVYGCKRPESIWYANLNDQYCGWVTTINFTQVCPGFWDALIQEVRRANVDAGWDGKVHSELEVMLTTLNRQARSAPYAGTVQMHEVGFQTGDESDANRPILANVGYWLHGRIGRQTTWSPGGGERITLGPVSQYVVMTMFELDGLRCPVDLHTAKRYAEQSPIGQTAVHFNTVYQKHCGLRVLQPSVH